jgi:hypothetical protein
MLFRKKPVVVEAYQTDVEVQIETLEGVMTASPGDWIITGVKGEQYPCKPDIFEATYEPVEEQGHEECGGATIPDLGLAWPENWKYEALEQGRGEEER